MVVGAGDRIPIDGTILVGDAVVDESSLTGESLPKDKSVGMQVFSSTLVFSGGIRIHADRVGKDTTLERIIVLVKSAREQKSKINTLGERFGKIYLVGVLFFAALLYYVTRDTRLVLAVILVVCADDVAIAIPLAFLGAIGSAAKNGVIVKGGAHLEVVGRAKIFVFDKTGTLTKGKLEVSDLHATAGSNEDELVRYAALASRESKHPLSLAILRYAASKNIEEEFPSSSSIMGGKGIIATYKNSRIIVGRMAYLESEHIQISDGVKKEADRLGDEGKSMVLAALDGRVLGIIALQDEPKDEAKKALDALRELQVTRFIMLTGDNARVAKVVADRVGIDEFYAHLLPEDKVFKIRELAKESEVVMVGDGVNDAAALSAATVGVAMGGIGHDTAIESANIVLMNDDLMKLVDTVKRARHVQRISWQDFGIWGITNAFGLVLVFAGVIGPSGAAAYNFVSDFFPLGNSMRTWFMKKGISAT